MSHSPRVGVGFRHTHFPYFENNGEISVDFFEAITENFMNTRGRPFNNLIKMREKLPVFLHGVSLSIASTEDLDLNYLKKLKELYSLIEPEIISDHLCWTGLANNNLHNLLPFPLNEESLNWVCQRVDYVQNFFKKQMLLENLSAYFVCANSSMSEAQFLNELCSRCGSGILLDLNNIYVNSVNQKFIPQSYIQEIDLRHVKQIHLAGFSDFGDYLFDTHSAPVYSKVWDILSELASLVKDIPILVEWDENIPEYKIVEKEAIYAKTIIKRALSEKTSRLSEQFY